MIIDRRPLAAGLAALGLALAACGGGSGSTAPAGSAATTSTPAPATAPAAPAAAPASAAPSPPAGGPVPAHFDPVAFSAVSPREFWLLGTAPCSHPVCTSIVRTTDGGAHFVGIPAPLEAVSLSGSGLSALFFADPLDGYAGGRDVSGGAHTLWSTHDGGRHWRVTRGDVLTFTVTAGHIFALTGRCANGVCSELALTRSPAAADDWTPVPLPSGTASGPPSLTASGTSVFLSLTPSAGTPSHQTLLVSRDGGRTFHPTASPCYSGLSGSLQASSPAVVWAICPTGMEAGAWRTADSGRRWSPLAGLRTSGSDGGLANSAALAPASDTAALLSPGGEMALRRTTDSGASFSPVAFPPRPLSVQWFGFTDPSTASALVSGSGPLVGPTQLPTETLYRSGDGGRHWHAVHIAG